MSDIRAILVCVDYWDYLALTLPHNRHHFDDVMVVTTPQDKRSQFVATRYGAQVYMTESFYDDGADFNKWKALEEGLDAYGREGLMCIMDADILWPRDASFTRRKDHLITPTRRMMPSHQEAIPAEHRWKEFPLHGNLGEFAGYSQIFFADDIHLPEPPWHETNWRHAGGADSFFQRLWPDNFKIRPGFEVLHLGESGSNWCGRSTPYLTGETPDPQRQRTMTTRTYMRNRRESLKQTGDPYAWEKL